MHIIKKVMNTSIMHKIIFVMYIELNNIIGGGLPLHFNVALSVAAHQRH